MLLRLARFSSLALGLMAGALLAEGAILVPYWRSVDPPVFLDWYQANGGLLLAFFGPLEVVTTALALGAAVVAWRQGSSVRVTLVVVSALAVALLLMFPLYFQDVNASFAQATIAHGDVAAELGRWAIWHWARVGIAVTAFGLSITTLSSCE